MIISKILNSKIFNKSRFYAFLMVLLAFPVLVSAQDKAGNNSDKPYDPKPIIFEHIGDSHMWHIIGKKAIALPVILYTDKGLEVFSAENIAVEETEGTPEKKIYQGKYYSYISENDKIKVVDASGAIDEAASKKVWDF